VSYAKIDDKILDCKKAIEAGEEATNLLLRMIVWCNEQRTDGKIPAGALDRLTSRRDRRALAARLVHVGWLFAVTEGWEIVGYLEHNKSRVQIEEEEQAARERTARWRAGKDKRDASQGRHETRHAPVVSRVTDACCDASHSSPLLSSPLEPTPSPLVPRAAGESDRTGTPAAAPKVKAPKRTPTRQASEVGARVLAAMTERSGTGFRYSPELEARVAEGIPEADLLAVVEHEARRDGLLEWKGGKYYRPSTLFGPKKWDERRAAAVASQPGRSAPDPAADARAEADATVDLWIFYHLSPDERAALEDEATRMARERDRSESGDSIRQWRRRLVRERHPEAQEARA
jgi:hypothetical protein